jgi:hypothetical protein
VVEHLLDWIQRPEFPDSSGRALAYCSARSRMEKDQASFCRKQTRQMLDSIQQPELHPDSSGRAFAYCSARSRMEKDQASFCGKQTSANARLDSAEHLLTKRQNAARDDPGVACCPSVIGLVNALPLHTRQPSYSNLPSTIRTVNERFGISNETSNFGNENYNSQLFACRLTNRILIHSKNFSSRILWHLLCT